MKLCASELENLKIIPSGPIPPNPVELLASKRFKKLLNQLAVKYDRIILDGPPHHGFADILVLSQQVGGIVLVSSIGETSREALRHFKKGINNVNGTILGCMVNKVNTAKRYGYRSYYRYYQAYEYDSANSAELPRLDA
jgi:capsular exopolysaccharide synthesis family protein